MVQVRSVRLLQHCFRARQHLAVEIYLDTSNQVNKALFDELYADKHRWESLIGFPLTWERMDEAKASRIYVQRAVTRVTTIVLHSISTHGRVPPS